MYLLRSMMPEYTARDAWTLFGGYPDYETFGSGAVDAPLRVMRGRHYLWDMRRRREWLLAVETYLQAPRGAARGYMLDALDDAPVPREPSRAARRFEVYETLLTTSPAFRPLATATCGAGEVQVRCP
jgi:hypothetical protein